MVAVGKRFRKILRKAKLPSFRLYDLRHTYATQLLAEEAPITYVAAQLGHARPTTRRWRTTPTGSAAATSDGSTGWRRVGRRPRLKLAPKPGTKRGRRRRLLRNSLKQLEPGAGVEPATY